MIYTSTYNGPKRRIFSLIGEENDIVWHAHTPVFTRVHQYLGVFAYPLVCTRAHQARPYTAIFTRIQCLKRKKAYNW